MPRKVREGSDYYAEREEGKGSNAELFCFNNG